MKKLIYNTILIILGIFVITSCSNSEYSLGNLVPGQYHKIAYFKNSGEDSLRLYTTQSNYQDTLTIIKAGSDPSLTADLKVNVMPQSEVDSLYSNVQGVNYKVIPQEDYSFNNGQNVTFGKGETGKILTMTINPIKIYQLEVANPGVKYVLPLQLVSNKKDSVNSTLDKVLSVVSVTSPAISFQNASQTSQIIYKTLNVSVPMILSNCDSNRWDIKCTLDQSQNSQLVASYNSSNGTNYQLLPDGSYTISGLEFTKGNFQTTPTISIDRSYLQNDQTYILPLKLEGTSMGEEIGVSSTPSLLIISNPKYGMDTPDRSQWKVLFCNNDNKMAGTGSDAGGPYALLDGNINTYWSTNWQSGSVGSSEDDYAYAFTDYNAFLKARAVNKTVIVFDMGAVKNLVGIGVTQRQGWANGDLQSCDIYVSNDASFNFKPIKNGGTIADYDAVALNNWTKLCSVTAPAQNATYWQNADLSTIQNGGIKGRFVKIQFISTRRSLDLTEFYVTELLSINGNAVQ